MYNWCVCTICLFAFFETERNLKSIYIVLIKLTLKWLHTSITIILRISDCFIITILL